MTVNRKELVVVSMLSISAALRVFFFCAAFPFFSDIDEDLHFDLVAHYSHLRPPQTFDLVGKETLDWIVPYASPEYLQTPDRFPDGKFGLPLWKRSGPETAEVAEATREDWSRQVNFESSQPPLYYLVTGVWWRLGQLLGLSGLTFLYWIRFLNVPLVATMVWLGYLAARAVEPIHSDIRLGVPCLLAFIPQSVFFTINNDVLSPITGGALVFCVLCWLRTATPTLLLGVCSGLAVAAAYLTKFSNLPLIVVALGAIGAISISRARREPVCTVRALALLLLCAAVPIGGWLLWMNSHFGDVTGSTTKVTLLGWTRKPMADWWSHPIFSARGLWTFWRDLLATFWRGELKWLSRPLNAPIADTICAISSLLFPLIALAATFRQRDQSLLQRQAIAVAALIFLACVSFFALLSVQFDFGRCINPSRAHPYFSSGRLLSGALIPFALVYVYAIAFGLRRISAALPLIVLAGLLLFVTVTDFLIVRVMFLSEYNWFHR